MSSEEVPLCQDGLRGLVDLSLGTETEKTVQEGSTVDSFQEGSRLQEGIWRIFQQSSTAMSLGLRRRSRHKSRSCFEPTP